MSAPNIPRVPTQTLSADNVSPRRSQPLSTLSVQRSPRSQMLDIPISSPTDKMVSPMSSFLKNKRNNPADSNIKKSPRFRDMTSPRSFGLKASVNEVDNTIEIEEEESVSKESDSEEDTAKESDSEEDQ
ncbi:septin-9 [Acrasis kona]|uniref:Septin-9 n=1 Tax=Acrasis kona TaxID=1008807 RepID=A0AAW2ZJE5_9EUKA